MSKLNLTCIICPNGCPLEVTFNDKNEIVSLTGYKCKRGETYVRSEIVNPVRVMTSIVRIQKGAIKMCPVRTNKPITKGIIQEMAMTVSKITLQAPVQEGDVIVKNIMGTGANLVVCRTIPMV